MYNKYKESFGGVDMTVRIQKRGNSFGISIPEKLLELLQWNDDDQMNITAKKIVLLKRFMK